MRIDMWSAAKLVGFGQSSLLFVLSEVIWAKFTSCMKQRDGIR